MSQAYKKRAIISFEIKRPNRRIEATATRDGSIGLRWTKLSEGRPIVTTTLLTRDAAIATVACMIEALQASDTSKGS